MTSIGGFVFAVGVLLFFVNVWKSRRDGAPAGADPWGGSTLEWSTPSPPPPYNFAVVPTIASRHPLWEAALDPDQTRSSLARGMALDDGREALVTTPLDAEPERIVPMPGDTLAPLALAVGLLVLFAGLLVKLWWLAGLGGLITLAALVAWLWPRRKLLERVPARLGAARG